MRVIFNNLEASINNGVWSCRVKSFEDLLSANQDLFSDFVVDKSPLSFDMKSANFMINELGFGVILDPVYPEDVTSDEELIH